MSGARNMRRRNGVRVFQGSDEGVVQVAIAVLYPKLHIIQHPELTTHTID